MNVLTRWSLNFLHGLKWMAIVYIVAMAVVVLSAPSFLGYIFVSGGTLAAVLVWCVVGFLIGTIQKWYIGRREAKILDECKKA